jgi:putative membrane protein
MKSRMLISAIAAAALLTAGSVTQAQDKAAQAFLTKAIQGNYAEVAMGELAQKNGQTDAVKSFGRMLTEDHGAANQKATQVARSMGVNPPNGPNKKQQADHDKMAKATGAQFDRQFAKHMVADHKKDISEYQKAAKKQDAAGQYAQETLPTLEKHLDTAQSIGR